LLKKEVSEMDKIRWGIVGTGSIGGLFTDEMQYVPGAIKAAVCSRSIKVANDFADKYDIGQRYDDYDRMLEEAELDIVYIGVPNMLHYEYVMKALDAGKNVLCEKPMADNIWQLNEMIEKAAKKNVFFMEALWSRCFPVMKKVREWIDGGRIGRVRSVRVNFGLKANEGWQGWKAYAEYAGGAIRDLGPYTLGMVFAGFSGEYPVDIASSIEERNGADYHSELLLKYSGGRTAFITNSFDMVADQTAVFYGDEGSIICRKIWNPDYAELFTYKGEDEFTGNSVEVARDDYPARGYHYEIQHVQDCLASGKKESNLFSLDESIMMCKLIDSVRKDWGVRFPSDRGD